MDNFDSHINLASFSELVKARKDAAEAASAQTGILIDFADVILLVPRKSL